MPSRNVLKIDVADSYYHSYARGNSKARIFIDNQDYKVFLNLFKRYLSEEVARNKLGVPYPHLYNKIELMSYCLMPNHFHLLIYQRDQGSMTLLMRGVMTSYSRYFNKKYKRTGALYESRYKASMILRASYLEHISRYIHLNPTQWRSYEFSSLRFYLGAKSPTWLQPQRIQEMFIDEDAYLTFLTDYEASKHMHDEIKQSLANDTTPYFQSFRGTSSKGVTF